MVRQMKDCKGERVPAVKEALNIRVMSHDMQ